jgi:hypothetical protein
VSDVELPSEAVELLRMVEEEEVSPRLLAHRLARLVVNQHAAINQLMTALKSANESGAESVAMFWRVRDERDALKEALEEALRWATPFDQSVTRAHASELLPMYTRIGGLKRAERLVELRKFLNDDY